MGARFLIVFLIFLGSIFSGFLYLQQPAEQESIIIRASREVELGLPVYAQFVVTQTMNIQDVRRVSKLEIPMYAQGLYPTVRLYRNGSFVTEWVRPGNSSGDGLKEANYVLDPPRLLDGTLEVEFDGGAISHEQQDQAPKLFIETANNAYPYGNYRIAENEKEGDVALTIYEETSRWGAWYHSLDHRPYDRLSRIVFFALLIMCISFLPLILKESKE